jgi:anti-sigma factor RsiW
MNKHLSSKQISRWIAGQQTSKVERHLEQCAECSMELTRSHSGFVAFAQSVREWAQQQKEELQPAEIRAWTASRNRWRPWVLGLAAGVVALAVGIPAYRSSRDAREKDAQLLEQVQTQLSRSVPASMEPLMRLMGEETEEPR